MYGKKNLNSRGKSPKKVLEFDFAVSVATLNPSNLVHKCILILLISIRKIKSEIKILRRKAEIDKVKKIWSKTAILLLNPLSCINKNSINVTSENKQEKFKKFKLLLQTRLK